MEIKRRIKRIKDRDARDEALLHYILKRKYNLRPLRERGGIMEESHLLRDDYCENWTEFWIEEGWQDRDDEELKQYRKELWKRSPYPWDCSGVPISLFLRTKRISDDMVLFIHYQGLDI